MTKEQRGKKRKTKSSKKRISKTLVIACVLIFTLALLMKFQYDKESQWDTFWIHGMSESISTYGYAKWIWHPASLFGYYPLSYPSSFMFFLSSVSLLTGLSMEFTIRLVSATLGMIGIYGVFLLGKRLGDFHIGLLSAFVFSVSPFFTGFTNWAASARVMLIVLYPLFLLLMLDFAKGKRMKYGITLLLTFIFLASIHRMAQMMVVFIIAFIASIIILHYKEILLFLKNHYATQRIYSFFEQRYRGKPLRFLKEAGIVLVFLIVFKLTDLMLRNRLLINIIRRMNSLMERVDSLITNPIILGGLIILLFLGIVALYGMYLLYQKKVFQRYGSAILKSEPKIIASILFLAFVYFFVKQFLGQSNYAPSANEYLETSIVKGSSPLALFANVIINYHTMISVLLLFGFLAIFYLIIKQKKSFPELLFALIMIGFAQFLIDKRYTRMFITPLFCLMIGLGLWVSYMLLRRYLKDSFIHHFTKYGFVLLLLGATLSSNLLLHRETFVDPLLGKTPTDTIVYSDHQLRSLATYVNSQAITSSILTTDQHLAGVMLFAHTGIAGPPHNVYYNLDPGLIQPQRRPWEEIKRDFKSGKLKEIWYVEDWIAGGEYYAGKHGWNLFRRSVHSDFNKRVMDMYNEDYFVRDRTRKETAFYKSLKDIKNKMYDSPQFAMYDLRKGR